MTGVVASASRSRRDASPGEPIGAAARITRPEPLATARRYPRFWRIRRSPAASPPIPGDTGGAITLVPVTATLEAPPEDEPSAENPASPPPQPARPVPAA